MNAPNGGDLCVFCAQFSFSVFTRRSTDQLASMVALVEDVDSIGWRQHAPVRALISLQSLHVREMSPESHHDAHLTSKYVLPPLLVGRRYACLRKCDATSIN
jgi:hypothetical protein